MKNFKLLNGLDDPVFGLRSAISLKIDFEDSLESQAVILLARADGAGDLRCDQAPTAAYASSRPIAAVSSTTSGGTSSGMKICRKHSYGPCSWPGACWSRSAASAAAMSIPCTRQRSSASVRVKAHRAYEFGVKVSVATTRPEAPPHAADQAGVQTACR